MLTRETAAVTYKLKDAQINLDWLISATPSGERRNALTDVNIKLLMLIDDMTKLPAEK